MAESSNGQFEWGQATNGVNAGGAIDYVRELNLNVINGAIDALNDDKDVRTALRTGWQGQAEVNFERNLTNGINACVSALEKVKKGVEALITDLVEDLAEQDKQLVKEEDVINL